MYQYEQVDVFRAIIDQCNQGRTIALNQAGERKVPKEMGMNMLENINSNFTFPRARRDTFARKTFFPKTKVQEKILYKKPPFTLKNQPKYHTQSGLPVNYAGQGIVPNPHRFVRPSHSPVEQRPSYHRSQPAVVGNSPYAQGQTTVSYPAQGESSKMN
jgi:hypothetical protein